MKKLLSKDLLGIRNLSVEEINLIFDTADKFKEVLNRPIKKVPSLRHLTIANVFFENSTRTKLSFELAQKRLSADIINFSSSVSSVIFMVVLSFSLSDNIIRYLLSSEALRCGSEYQQVCADIIFLPQKNTKLLWQIVIFIPLR